MTKKKGIFDVTIAGNIFRPAKEIAPESKRMTTEIALETIVRQMELNVSDSTKLTRLKSLKAILSKFHNSWLPIKFWLNI